MLVPLDHMTYMIIEFTSLQTPYIHSQPLLSLIYPVTMMRLPCRRDCWYCQLHDHQLYIPAARPHVQEVGLDHQGPRGLLP